MDLFSGIEEPTLPFLIPNNIVSSCHWDDKLKVFFLTVPNGELIFSENFFSKKISDRSIEYFQENDSFDWKSTDWSAVSDQTLENIKFTNINWKHDQIKLYGKKIPLPRLTSWHGDQGKAYTYSGITSQPSDWNEGLLYIKKEIEKISQETFNSVLLNWYRNGEDHLNWHADDEKELGKNPVIASVNFGESRDFVIRRNDDPSIKIKIPLNHGALLIMRGELQHFWQHSVPKRKKVLGSRFNLTFRRIFLEGI
jgi:alkylated DNA repair dioxygenase AlkB